MAEELPEECCAKCRFADDIDSEEYVCRRYPPIPASDEYAADKTYSFVRYFTHPDVEPSDWCGEFQPRKDTPATPRISDDAHISYELPLSIRAVKVLRHACEGSGYADVRAGDRHNFGMVRKLSWEAICRTRHCGPYTQKEIANFCHANGITIPGMPPKDTP